MNTIQGQIHYFSGVPNPILEVLQTDGEFLQTSFNNTGPGRTDDETHWVATPTLSIDTNWQFRINLDGETYDTPLDEDYYSTSLTTLWLQDGEIFSYQPAPTVSPARVVKIPEFVGSLPTRALYVYLPRGYKEHTTRHYPVLYMHDGQNCFETFVQDSFSGSWKAEETANYLIKHGRMCECIIVGVSNGERDRLTEYLPLYSIYYPPPPDPTNKDIEASKQVEPKVIFGSANRTIAYYQNEVALYIRQHYRILEGRDNTATCGSSMGGLFSTYIAWECVSFARHHAIMSPSYWITKNPQDKLETVERMRSGLKRDIRIWLDTGTLYSEDRGDDGMAETLLARDALLENGYTLGPDFQFYIDEGGIHHESTWAARLDKVFQFLFPPR